MAIDSEAILQTLILNEQKAADIYGILAERLDGPVRTLFLELLEDEQRHERIYRAVLDKYRKQKKIHAPVSEEDEDYMQLMLRNNIFSKDRVTEDEANELLKHMTPLEVAEKIETDGIMYGTELQRLYPDFAPDEISLILAEERRHLRKVFALKVRSQN